MKIVAACHRLDWTGAPVVLFRLLCRLAERHDVTLLAPQDPQDGGPLAASYEAAGIPVARAVAMRRHDVLLANTLTTSGLLVEASRILPTLWWIHEPAGGAEMIAADKVDLRAFDAADLICFPTAWQRDVLYRDYLGAAPSLVVPAGIAAAPRPGARPAGMAAPGIHLVNVGYLCRRKGQMTAVEAVSRLRLPDLQLHLIGSTTVTPRQSAEITGRIAADPFLRTHVTVHGPLPHEAVGDWIAHADAMVFPTEDDLIATSILEAMSYGVCVVASSFGPIPETVTDGEAGLLFPPGDAEALAMLLARIRGGGGRRRRRGGPGRPAAGARHDLDRHVDAMEAALEQAIDRHRRRRG